jgi:opacity protein-like surface antigen
MKKIYLFIILSGFLAIQVNAQPRGYVSLQYPVSFATGDMGQYISKTSFRGFLFEYRHNITPKLVAGVDAGWNVFYERKSFDTYTAKTISLSGVQYRYHNEFPLMATAEYFLTQDQMFQPYVGLGIGTIYSERNTEMGIYYMLQDAWQFALRPEIGTLLNVSDKVSFKLSVKYYNGFKGGDLDTQSYLSVCGGIAFTF